jgi:Pyridoxal-dependent decarboxylase, pyridoxal binding domain
MNFLKTCLILTLIAITPLLCFGRENQPDRAKELIQVLEEQFKNKSISNVRDKFQFIYELSLKSKCEDNFHVVDVGVLIDRLSLWQTHLPTVKPYYALKTNNDPVIAHTLGILGTGFDCASQNEIEQVLNLGIDFFRNCLY